MKFKFKIQDYQTQAVKNTTDVFVGQPCLEAAKYRRDLGTNPFSLPNSSGQLSADLHTEGEDEGYRNADIRLDNEQLLKNLQTIQSRGDIPLSKKLSREDGLGAVNLDIEMETGTGKTYVYIKTMFELNRLYGWSKFIVVVPSIAIREGVAKSFSMLEDHFMELYGKKARWFIYNSANLNQLDQFSQDAALNVMIINTQAFAASLKEDGRSKESRIIYEKRDEFASRRPIDVIAANRPIIIRDEPQKMEGTATQTALKKFRPLFVLNYSATHRIKHDTVYALDALDAYREKLVKRIKVIGFELKNLSGTNSYMYLDDIVLSPTQPPVARIEIEVKSSGGAPRRTIRKFGQNDSLYVASNHLTAYKDFVIAEIIPGNANDPVGYVRFTNNIVLRKGEVFGDDSEKHMQRVQIRETIKTHFEKERELFEKGIKCLSLFFIDEVARYRAYGEDGEEIKGELQKIFEEEYNEVKKEQLELFTKKYNEYVSRFTAEETHRGYFSIDKKGRMVDTKVKRGGEGSEDASDYDLILRDKERLLSFDEPTRFIFSHSALREGWDNPNVFQICTLRHGESEISKRQEVGRGLRICVDKDGVRQDQERLGEEVHNLNVLTVITNESYTNFTSALQSEIKVNMRQRATKATSHYFEGKTIVVNGQDHVINNGEASRIMVYLEDNRYVDENGLITPAYHTDLANNTLKLFSEALAPMGEEIIRLINSIFDPSVLEKAIEDGAQTKIPKQQLNENFEKDEFKALWNEINHQYVYTVSYNSDELIKHAITHLNSKELTVPRLSYIRKAGIQTPENPDGFGDETSTADYLSNVSTTTVKYDLVGQIAKGANITRLSAVKILKGLLPEKIALFRNNPEEFIRKSTQIIREQKATMIVEHIHYETTKDTYDSGIFTVSSHAEVSKAYGAKKHITDYVIADSEVERNFAKELDGAEEVTVYAKLPRCFAIPTPVGNYAPDWAIAMQKGKVKHIFFVAETKGTLDSMKLSVIENAKIRCCEKLFDEMSNKKVRYHKVTSFKDLMDAMEQ